MYYRLHDLVDLLTEEIVESITMLDVEITFLDVHGSQLGNRGIIELISIFTAFKFDLQGIDLRLNNLGLLQDISFRKFIAVLPRSLQVLNLSNNNLWNFNGLQWRNAFAELPRLTHLDLANNLLWQRTIEITMLLKVIKPGLRHLGLGSNQLANLGNMLVDVCSAIPYGTISVDLRNNELGNFQKISLEDVITSMEVLPDSVTHVDLNGNDFTVENMIILVNNLPKNIKTIGIYTFRKITKDEFLTYELMRQFVEIVGGTDDINALNSITLYKTINENCMNRYITILEKMNKPLAFLMCALFLDGRIENGIGEKNNYDIYFEKRVHNAIDFYCRAAEEKELQNLIITILKNIRINCNLLSVYKRMQMFDIFGTQVKMPLANEMRLFPMPRYQNMEIVPYKAQQPGYMRRI